MIMLYLRV